MEFFLEESILHKKSVFLKLVYDTDFAMLRAFVSFILTYRFFSVKSTLNTCVTKLISNVRALTVTYKEQRHASKYGLILHLF